jgi:hypothetical protein
MTEYSMLWNGTSTGDAGAGSWGAPYDFDTELASIFSALTGAEGVAGHGGVFRDALNKYNPSFSANQVTIDTGLGLAYGNWHYNTAPLNIAIPTAVGTRIDRIVLRKDWSAQTVRLTRIAGTVGAGAPALTQSLGGTWDVPLFQVTIVGSAPPTLSLDERVFLPVHGNQNGEGGTKHSYGQISGTPAISGSVTTIVPGAVGTPGSSGALSDGAHQHPLAADPAVVRTTTWVVPTASLADDPELQLTIPAAGTYEFHGCIMSLNQPGSIQSIFAFTGATTFLRVGWEGPNADDGLTNISKSGTFASFCGAGPQGDGCIFFRGILVAGGIGTLKHQGYATTAFSELAGSYIHAEKIA